MDLWHWITEKLDYYRYTVIGIVLAVGMFGGLVAVTGCASKTSSLITGQPVTRVVFEREMIDVDKALNLEQVQIETRVAEVNEKRAARNALIDAGYTDLERQDAYRAQFINAVGLTATQAAAGTLSPANLIPIGIGLLGGLFGLGLKGDLIRKDGLLKKDKAA